MKSWNTVISCGQAHLQLRASMQKHLRLAADELGFKYLRFHGLLSDDMRVVTRRKDGTLAYNWQIIDELYDAILEAGLKPFVEFSFMPSVLASGIQTIFTWKCNVTMPASMEQWTALISALLHHWIERYGRFEVRQWFFEVWNEPNLPDFFAGTMQDYFTLYDATAKTIKAVGTDLRVGGPSTARGSWIDEFLSLCQKHRTPLDFITTHVYGNDDAFFTDKPDYQSRYLGPHYLFNVVKHVHESVSKSIYGKLPVYWTEWNSSWNPRTPERETANQGAFILKTLRQVNTYVDGFAYWTLSDIYEEGFYPDGAFVGLYGLLSIHGFKKPAYFAYACLNRLGENVAPLIAEHCTENCSGWIAEKKDSTTILLYYFKDWIEKGDPAPHTITIPVPKRKMAEVFLFDNRHNNILADWQDMDAPQYPTPVQIKTLHEKNEMVSNSTMPISELGITVTMYPGSFCLIEAR